MKNLVFISIAFGLLLTSCYRDNPQAQFSVNYSEVQPDEIILFTNLSHDAISYLWDFGDGTTSTLEHPSHFYLNEDDYQVTLTVTSADGERDVISKWVYVWYTVLHITAVEWNPDEIQELIIPNAFIVLYKTLNDWVGDDFPIASGFTDNIGELEFYPLYLTRYWVWVEATDVEVTGDRYDNWDFYEFDYYPEDYLATTPIISFDVNYWIAWADYFGPMKKKESRLENYDIEKIKAAKNSFIIFDVSK